MCVFDELCACMHVTHLGEASDMLSFLLVKSRSCVLVKERRFVAPHASVTSASDALGFNVSSVFGKLCMKRRVVVVNVSRPQSRLLLQPIV